jgi:cytochrome c oxidase subunit II
MLKKRIGFVFAATVLSASLLSACGSTGTSSNNAAPSGQASAATTTPAKSTDSTKATSSSAVSSSSTASVKTDNILLMAKDFEYDKKEIHVKKGDKVKITLKSDDGGHGFTIPDYKVNIQGNGSAEFVADKAGTFEYHCSVMCGSGHTKMTGKLIVQ